MSNILEPNNLPQKVALEKRAINLEGEKSGLVTALYCCGRQKNEPGMWWVCQCKCGNYIMIRASHLVKKQVTSCGCQRRTKELVGRRFGKLEVLERAGTAPDRSALWLCRCDCGTKAIIRGVSLKNGSTKSCGCIKTTGEWEIQQILLKNNVDYLKEYSFEDLKDNARLRFDFAIFMKNELVGLIEYQGAQHYDTSSKFCTKELLKHDQMKKEYCDKNKIPLFYITGKDNIEGKVYEILFNINRKEENK